MQGWEKGGEMFLQKRGGGNVVEDWDVRRSSCKQAKGYKRKTEQERKGKKRKGLKY